MVFVSCTVTVINLLMPNEICSSVLGLPVISLIFFAGFGLNIGSSSAMLTYTPTQLRAMNHTRPPPRDVRKLLFITHLWQPERYRGRRRLPAVGPRAVTVNVNKPSPRSADPSMTIGWLNVQSLTNKIDVVTSTIDDHSLDVLA